MMFLKVATQVDNMVKKEDGIIIFICQNTERQSREVIMVEPLLVHCMQFWSSNCRKNVMTLNRV